LLKPDASGTPRPTLLMIGSGDTVVEDLYAYIGPAGLQAQPQRADGGPAWPGTWRCGAGDAAGRQGADARGGALGRSTPIPSVGRLRYQRRRVAVTSFGL
jgi:hypothetical protein